MPRTNSMRITAITNEDRNGVARSYRTGSFKWKVRTNKDGGTVRYCQGYVYALDGTKHYANAATKKAAETAAKAKATEHDAARLAPPPAPIVAPPVPTFGEWLLAYNDHKRKQGRKDKTNSRYADLARQWSALDPDDKGPLGPRPIDTVGITELELCVAILRKSYAQNSLRTAKCYLAGAYQRAYLLKHIERNEVALLDPIGFRRKRSLNVRADGYGELMRAATGDPTMTAALLLGRYGLRIGEVCGVTSDDLRGNVLTLSRQLGRVKEQGEHGPKTKSRPTGARPPRGGSIMALCALKSESAARRIRLTDDDARTLMAALDSAKPDVIWDAVEGKWRTDCLFVCHGTGNGKGQSDNKLRDRFTRLCTSVGANANYHDLRSLFATSAADAGIPIAAISRAIGHSSTAITELYIRDLQDSDAAIWDATAAAVAKALSPS